MCVCVCVDSKSSWEKHTVENLGKHFNISCPDEHFFDPTFHYMCEACSLLSWEDCCPWGGGWHGVITGRVQRLSAGAGLGRQVAAGQAGEGMNYLEGGPWVLRRER